MSKTSLAFFRKPQTLSSWRFERPKSLDTVRRVVSETLGELDFDLECIEREFYGGKTVDEDIKVIVGPVRRATRRLSVSYLHSASQIRELGRKSRVEEDLEEPIVNDVKDVQEYHQKVCQFIPSAFKDLITDIIDIQQCLEKYCLSFWEGEKDPYMESAHHYDTKRKDTQAATDSHLQNISAMAEAYKGSEGLQVSMFGITSNDIARRCGVGDLPFLLMFPEACQNIRSITLALSNWVKDDEQYVTFLRNDVTELEKKHQMQKQLERDIIARVVHWRKGVELNKKQIKQLKMELTRVRQREKVIDDEIDNLEKEIRFVELDIDSKNKEKDRCRQELHEVHKGHRSDLSERIDQLTLEMTKLRFSIPSIQKQIEVQRMKKKSITEKKKLIIMKTGQIEEMKSELSQELSNQEKNEKELERIDFCLQCLRKIILRRTASDITKRIFHNLPIGPTLRQVGTQNQAFGCYAADKRLGNDDLYEAILVTSEHIGSDWPKLYVELMTKVAHGHNTIERDIKEITEEKYRATHRVQALRALRRWRRFDAIASVDVLKATLLALRHKDIVHWIEERFSMIAAERARRQRHKVQPVVVNTKDAEEAATRFMVAKGPLRSQLTSNKKT